MVKDGWRFVVPLGVLTAAAMVLYLATDGRIALAGALLAGSLTWFCVHFFRDPVRTVPQDPSILVSPADGRVLGIRKVKDPYVGPSWEILIFLNIFNVHSQRSPFTGPSKVAKVTYHPGKFLA